MEQLHSPEAEQLRGELKSARQRVSEDFEALGNKLSVDNVKHETNRAWDDTRAKVNDGLQRARGTASEQIRQNQVPLALIGIGVGWWMMNNKRRNRSFENRPYQSSDGEFQSGGSVGRMNDSISHTAEDVKFKAREAAARVGQAGHDAKERVEELSSEFATKAEELWLQGKDRSRQAVEKTEMYYDDNPLVVGAGALAAGLALGYFLPSTTREDEWMGPARNRIRELKDDAQRSVQERLKDASRAMRQQAEAEGLAGPPARERLSNAKAGAQRVAEAGMEQARRLSAQVPTPGSAPKVQGTYHAQNVGPGSPSGSVPNSPTDRNIRGGG
jgi:ElaB/YqjD/DUF883 family membrane-anchored ribosome-binding protein